LGEGGFFLMRTALLILLLLGAVEAGWIINAQVNITGAAREGALAVAMEEDPQAAVERYVGTRAVTVTDVAVLPLGYEVGRVYQVRVNGQIKPLIIGVFLPDKFHMMGIATARQD
jgi:Flp pilus assembly protein TadG